jgi:8-oxo-dGTP pyrophosphatase MutT (NUDIX family)
MELVLTREVDYLPKPNLVQTFLASYKAPLNLTTTAFVVPVLSTGEIVFVNNRKRGIEKGETAEMAAVREAFEETGYVVADLEPIGFLQMSIFANKPDDYNYPYPLSYQQFFTGKVVAKTEYKENDECRVPVVERLENSPGYKGQNILFFLKEALKCHNIPIML